EAPVAQVAVEQFALRVAGLGLELLDLGIDVAIADQNVGPAVIVHIKKSAAPPEVLRMHAQACSEGGVLEIGSALIVIERRRISCEICFYDVEVSIQIVVGCRHAHARLRLAVGTQGAARFKRNVLDRKSTRL